MWPFGREFPAICNHCIVMTAWSRKTWKFCEQFFGKNDPSQTVINAWIASKICQGQPPHLAHTVTPFQISSKSIHFRRSYCRKREDRFRPVKYFQYRLFEPIITLKLSLHKTSVIRVRHIYSTKSPLKLTN